MCLAEGEVLLYDPRRLDQFKARMRFSGAGEEIVTLHWQNAHHRKGRHTASASPSNSQSLPSPPAVPSEPAGPRRHHEVWSANQI